MRSRNIIKLLIRQIVNWAYGRDISSDLTFLREANYNLSVLLHDMVLRDAAKGGTDHKAEKPIGVKQKLMV